MDYAVDYVYTAYVFILCFTLFREGLLWILYVWHHIIKCLKVKPCIRLNGEMLNLTLQGKNELKEQGKLKSKKQKIWPSEKKLGEWEQKNADGW